MISSTDYINFVAYHIMTLAMFNKVNTHSLLLVTILFLFVGCKNEVLVEPPVEVFNARISYAYVNKLSVSNNQTKYGLPSDSVVFHLHFSADIDPLKLNPSRFRISNGIDTSFIILKESSKNDLSFKIRKPLQKYTTYTLFISSGENLGVKIIENYEYSFVTELDETPKFPTISNDSLLTLVQKQTFKYFWDYAHPVSGLARERYNSGETVTIGGSGFGIMTIPVAIERGFITRQQGLEQMTKIVDFLKNTADKFHGVFPHWINGTTGKVQPFSANDNGADLIETSFLIQGLLAVQQYFNQNTTEETTLYNNIESIWRGVEWSWFQQNGQQKLFWHWSPDKFWVMNMPISGWNEGLIAYVLGASSPTYPIAKSVYDNGYMRNGAVKNGQSYYGIQLPLGDYKGGPLFFAHYSFLGLDPRNLSDSYANYWVQNTAHSKINYNYCIENPRENYGYNKNCWGLTASDIPNGYTASSPSNDVGVIAPTAALSSFPYTPNESMQALRFFYYVLGDKMWGDYGFKDSFCLNSKWFADSYLAIDQGPIVVMIENYRTGLLWNLFMKNTDIKNGLTKLGFTY